MAKFTDKTWTDRVSEQPQRRLLTPTDGSSAMTVDVTRQEGIVIQEGDAFSASNMNDLEQRIKTAVDANDSAITSVTQKANTNQQNISTLSGTVTTLNSKVTTLEGELTANGRRIYMDYKNGQYGYNTSASRGADTFFPFKRITVPSSITITGYCDGFQVRATAPAALCDLYNTLQFSQSGGTYASLDAGGTSIGSVGTYNLANYRGKDMTGIVLWLQDEHGPMYVYLTLSNPIS